MNKVILFQAHMSGCTSHINILECRRREICRLAELHRALSRRQRRDDPDVSFCLIQMLSLVDFRYEGSCPPFIQRASPEMKASLI
jgi:hypothetical protein